VGAETVVDVADDVAVVSVPGTEVVRVVVVTVVALWVVCTLVAVLVVEGFEGTEAEERMLEVEIVDVALLVAVAPPVPVSAVPVAVIAEVACAIDEAPLYSAGPGTSYESRLA
jgi:hypothetical protein